MVVDVVVLGVAVDASLVVVMVVFVVSPRDSHRGSRHGDCHCVGPDGGYGRGRGVGHRLNAIVVVVVVVGLISSREWFRFFCIIFIQILNRTLQK